MPEAVASNSRPVPERQPHPLAPSMISKIREDIEDGFDEVQEMLNAYNRMLVCLIEDTSHSDRSYAFGIQLLHEQIMRRLDAAVAEADQLALALIESARGQNSGEPAATDQSDSRASLWLGLTEKLIDIVVCVWRDLGREPDKANPTHQSKIVGLAERLGVEIIDRLEDKADQIEAGSFLPWAELRIRDELETARPEQAIEQALDKLSPQQQDGLSEWLEAADHIRDEERERAELDIARRKGTA